MKNVANLLIAVVAVSASQTAAWSSDHQKTTMYVLGSNAPLPTRPNREMLPALPMPAPVSAKRAVPAQVNDESTSMLAPSETIHTEIGTPSPFSVVASTSNAQDIILRGPISESANEASNVSTVSTNNGSTAKESTKRSKLMRILHFPTI